MRDLHSSWSQALPMILKETVNNSFLNCRVAKIMSLWATCSHDSWNIWITSSYSLINFNNYSIFWYGLWSLSLITLSSCTHSRQSISLWSDWLPLKSSSALCCPIRFRKWDIQLNKTAWICWLVMKTPWRKDYPLMFQTDHTTLYYCKHFNTNFGAPPKKKNMCLYFFLINSLCLFN